MEPADDKSVFVLPPEDIATPAADVDDASVDVETSLPEALLLQNIPIFCRFRWIVIAVLALLGIVAKIPAAAAALSLEPHMHWPLVAAAVLLVENLIFLTHYRRLIATGGPGARISLWGQIVVDLLVLTAVVHYTGSRQSVVHFAYAFHIVLACIFFPRRHSLVVTLLACILYGLCIAAEATGLLAPAGLFRGSTASEAMSSGPLGTVNFLLTVLFMLVVWYLASLLSAMVRRRDRRLDETNRRLIEAREERRQHMLQTTHELKAPLTAIDANTQLLLKGYCGELLPETRRIIERVHLRSERLARQVQEMLQLANLSSRVQKPLPLEILDLTDVLAGCVEQARDKAAAHHITLVEEYQPTSVVCAEEHLRMLLGNLLLNAVLYSHDGGEVRISCGTRDDGRAWAAIADNGIGIPAKKLPRIFDEHYRTTEAATHNKESTGLGLAIVRRIASLHHLTIEVASTPGKGTIFTILFPPP